MYSELFKEIEDELGIEVTERIGDSRFFAKENENNTDLFTSFYDNNKQFKSKIKIEYKYYNIFYPFLVIKQLLFH